MTSTQPALRVDVADLLTRPAARRPARWSASVTGLAGSAAAVADDDPLELDLVFERVPDGIVVRGAITACWRGECSSCLRDLASTITVHVDELFEPEPVEGDTYPLLDHELDLEQLVRDAVLLELPLAPTCARVGAGPCGHDVPKPDEVPAPDPRWHALSELEL